MENIKTVSIDDMREEIDRVNEALKGTIVEVSADRDGDGIVTAKINWGSIGRVACDEAIAFAEAVKKACEIAKTFKYNGFKAIYR